MKLLLFCLTVLLSTISIAQVGIGTTTPSALLDVRSTNQATPANNDGLLIPKVDEFPATSPTAAQDGMMVYVTGSGTPSKGFYYWDNGSTTWLSLSGTSEWTDNGAYLSPADGNSEDVTIGGTNNTNARLTVRSNKPITSLFTNSGTQDLTMYGVNTFLTNSSTQVNSFTIGNYNDVVNNGAGLTYGDYNRIIGTGTGAHYGEFNALSATGSGDHYGNQTILSGTGAGAQYGAYNIVSNTGTGDHTGVFNNLSGAGTGAQTGVRNNINNSENSLHTGVWNSLSGSGSGGHFGTYNLISGGTGSHFGTYNTLTSTGSGFKFGSYNSIPATAGGTHYGVYSDVLKSGSYAGYFLGRLAVGTTTGNIYTFPASRGTNGQVLETDGSGNVSWTTPTAGASPLWNLEGTTNSATAITDNMYHTGNIGIGSNLATYPLHIVSSADSRTIYTDLSNTTSNTSLDNTILSTSSNANTTMLRGLFVGVTATGTNEDLIGVNTLLSNSSNGTLAGTTNSLVTTGDGQVTGTSNLLTSTGSGDVYGVRNILQVGDGNYYGNHVTFTPNASTSGNSIIGNYVAIPTNANAGAHFGFYAQVLRTGGHAGYFLGNVTIGTTTSNTYTLPPFRGNNNEVMQTDGSGNVSWVNPATFGVDEINDLTDGKSDVTGSTVFLGLNAGLTDDGSDNRNVGVGFQALRANSTGERNVAVGYNSLILNTTGASNVGLGNIALSSNTQGTGNIGIGDNSLRTNTTGSFNVAAGYYALSGNVNGLNNIAIGNQSLFVSSSGAENSSVGPFAMVANTTGSRNTAFGGSALALNTTGSNNIALGYQAGQNTQTVGGNIPDKNIIIGYNIELPNLSGSNQLNIGNLIYGNNLNGFGQTNATGNIGIGVQAPLDKLDVGGMIRISTSTTNAAQLRNDDNFNHLVDNNIDFGDGEDAWMLSSLEGLAENSGIYGDRDFVTVWAPADSGRLIRFLDEDRWTDNDGDPYNNSAELAYVDNVGQFIQASDRNRKQNVRSINNAIQKINQIHGYTYEYKLSASEKQKGQRPVATSGVIAQELYEVLPEAVQVSENGEYFVHYAGIIPLLIEGLKEQQEIIANQQREIEKLKKLEERIKKIESNLLK